VRPGVSSAVSASLPSEAAGLRRESFRRCTLGAPWPAWVNARAIPTLVSKDRSPSQVDAPGAYGPGEIALAASGSFADRHQP
jgi:hypothetical protein